MMMICGCVFVLMKTERREEQKKSIGDKKKILFEKKIQKTKKNSPSFAHFFTQNTTHGESALYY